jgi:hypothetical protein
LPILNGVKIGLALVATLLLLLPACGSGGEEPPQSAPQPASLPGSVLPELDSRVRPLGAEALAADSYDPEALAELLDEAAFVAGTEREFSGKTRIFDHVIARTLVFRTAAGADTYLSWLRGHGEDFLGRVQAAEVSPPGESGVVFALVPCGICKKETPTFLAGWRRGATVLTLLAGGSGANPQTFSALARQFDEIVGPRPSAS